MSFLEVPLGPSWDLPPGPGVFTQDQIRCIEEDAIFLPLPQPQPLSRTQFPNRKRKVSAAFSPPRSMSSSSTLSASMETWGFQSNAIQTFDIPMAEESVEALEFIGFVAGAARLIYDRYLNRPEPDRNPDDLMAYACGYITSLKLSRYDNMSPREALRQIGLNRQIQEAIPDPRFSHVFGTQTLYYWAEDTVKTNYAALFSRQSMLKSYADQRMTHKEKYKQSRHEASLPQEQCKSQQPGYDGDHQHNTS
ncbi:uncharacterized protein N7498_003967 [Penicillium cinerascens]|uniref:Uncharacterized protein n=1 Tax=Penicillium cinerascens TaxID=70096 RepID=A0A9W9N333_9EURO|nr:uncharacterized protein N7498_003967 [Penicillium cinerascens]KAJ5212321.1 hypothetical protein N7498_003967 [Penicillium cinerascens]